MFGCSPAFFEQVDQLAASYDPPLPPQVLVLIELLDAIEIDTDLEADADLEADGSDEEDLRDLPYGEWDGINFGR